MKQHITAAFTSQIPDGGAPEEIVYFPEGVHQISATVDGKPGKLTVRIPAEKGPQIAAALQSALEKRRASNVRPWFDFEHKRGVASALPKAGISKESTTSRGHLTLLIVPLTVRF